MRRGQISYFPVVLTIGVTIIFALVLGRLLVAGQFDGHPPAIGEKQEAVLRAYSRADDIRLYAQQAAREAVAEAEKSGDFATPIAQRAATRFTALMRQYPFASITQMFNAKQEGDRIVFTSDQDLSVPVGTAGAATTSAPSGAGVLTVWPTDHHVITSLFGWRKAPQGGSTYHPAIDIRGAVGDPVYAVADGTAIAEKAKHLLQLTLPDGWTCWYLHIDPTANGPVTAGEKVATVGNIPGVEHHVDLRCFNDALLGPTLAENLWPKDYVKDGAATGDLQYAIIYDKHAFVDPYCLFTPALQQEALQSDLKDPTLVADTTGFTKRPGGDVATKLQDTCQAYAAQHLLAAAQTTSASTSSPPVSNTVLQKTLSNLKDQQEQGKSLYQWVQDTAKSAGVDPNLVIAVIAQESQGVIDAQSRTGVQGVMQVTCTTFQDTLHVSTCDKRADPVLSIQAGTYYLAGLWKKYDGYTQQAAFTAANYNGGGMVLVAVKRAGSDPSYDAAMARFTPQLLSAAPGYAGWTPQQLAAKVKETTDYGRKVSGYYGMLGGAVAPGGTSRTDIGTYTFALMVSAPIDKSYTDVLDLRSTLSSCGTTGCVTQALQRSGATACSDYASELQRTITECQQDQDQHVCGCPIPLPPLGVDAKVTPESILIGKTTTPVQWIVPPGDAVIHVTFSLPDTNDPLHPITGDTLTLSGTTVRLTDSANTILGGASGTLGTQGIIYATRQPDGQTLRLTNTTVGACFAGYAKAYCLDGTRFWVTQQVP